MLPKSRKESGLISPVLLLLVAVVGILGYLVVSSSFPFKDQFLGMLFPKDASHAAGSIDLSIIPSNVSVAQNQTFLADLAIDAKTDQPTALQFNIKFDPTKLQAVKIEPGYYFNTSDAFGAPQIDNTTGIVAGIFTQGPLPKGCQILNPSSCYFEYKTGYGSVATIEFKALQPTTPTTSITLDTTNGLTQVAALNKTGDQLGMVTNSNVTITSTTDVVTSAEFSLSPTTGTISGNEFPVQVRVLNSSDEANLFSARLNYDSTKIEISRIDTAGSFITQWVSDTSSFNNTLGRASIIGAVPNPGYKTDASSDLMATVYFKSKAAGTASIGFDGSSAVYRNSDNKNILASSTGGSYTTSAPVSPTPTPSATAAPTPTPIATVAPTPTPTATTIATPTPSPSAVASATALPTPTPTPGTGACTITNAAWISSANPIAEKSLVSLQVSATGDCTNSQVAFEVFEDDGVLGRDAVTTKPVSPIKFSTNNQARTSWLAEFQDDGAFGINNPPEYYFTAQLVSGGPVVQSASPLLTVTKGGTGGQLIRGDANRDGKLDLVDLSMLLTNWNKSQDFLDELDTNDDGVINVADYSNMLIDLRNNGTIISQ